MAVVGADEGKASTVVAVDGVLVATPVPAAVVPAAAVVASALPALLLAALTNPPALIELSPASDSMPKPIWRSNELTEVAGAPRVPLDFR